jgi:hypothetical protein
MQASGRNETLFERGPVGVASSASQVDKTTRAKGATHPCGRRGGRPYETLVIKVAVGRATVPAKKARSI